MTPSSPPRLDRIGDEVLDEVPQPLIAGEVLAPGAHHTHDRHWIGFRPTVIRHRQGRKGDVDMDRAQAVCPREAQCPSNDFAGRRPGGEEGDAHSEGEVDDCLARLPVDTVGTGPDRDRRGGRLGRADGAGGLRDDLLAGMPCRRGEFLR